MERLFFLTLYHRCPCVFALYYKLIYRSHRLVLLVYFRITTNLILALLRYLPSTDITVLWSKFLAVIKIRTAGVYVYDTIVNIFHNIFHVRHFFKLEKSYSKNWINDFQKYWLVISYYESIVLKFFNNFYWYWCT